MAENINIASFDFDTDKLIQSLTETKTAIQAQTRELNSFKKSLKDNQDTLTAYEKENAKIISSMAKLRNENKQNTNQFKDLEKALSDNEDQTKILKEQEEDLTQSLIILEPKLIALKNEYKLASSVLKAVTADTGEFVTANNKAAEAIDRQNKSINAARANNRELLDIRNELNPEIEEEARLIMLLNAKLDENNKFIKENVSAYERQKINIGNYADSIRSAFSDLNIFTREGLVNFISKSQEAGGTGKMLQGTFKEIGTGIWGITKASLAFIATPLGATLAVLAGFALAAKSVWDYNKSIEESVKLTKQLTGLTGTMADEVRTKAQAIADTFKQDFQKTLEVASQISQRTGQSITSVLDSINNGFTRGANANGRYLDSLEEMFPRLEKGGLSLAEVNALIEQSQGVFAGDKFVDTLGEAVVALEEFTKAQSDALTNAFGKSFSDKISNGINSGSMSAKNALLEIYKEAERVNLSTEQWATITADVFKGVGEDIGGAEVILRNYNEALANTNRELTEEEKLQQQITDAAIEAGKAKDEALKSDSVISLTKNLELFWNKVQIVFFGTVKWIREAYEWFWEISNRSESLSSIWNNLQKIGAAFGRVIDTLQTTFGRLAEKFGIGNSEGSKFMNVILSIFDPIKRLENALNLFADSIVWVIDQFSEASIRAEAFGRTIGQTFYYIKNLDFASLVDISDKMEENVDAIKKENDAYKAKQEMLKASEDLHNMLMGLTVEQGNKVVDITKEQVKSQKDLDKEREEAFRRELQRMNEELDLWIANQGIKARTLQEELDFQRQVAEDSIKILDYELKNKKITREKYAAEVKEIQNDLALTTINLAVENAEQELEIWQLNNQSKLDSSKRLTNALISEEKRRIDMQLILQQQALQEQNLNDQQYQLESQKLTDSANKKKSELDRLYNNQTYEENLAMQALRFEEDILLMQQRGEEKFEIEQAQRDANAQIELEKLNHQLEQENISEERYLQELKNIELRLNNETNEAKKALEQQQFETKLNFAQRGLDVLAEIAGKDTAAGKAVGVAKVGFDTAMAIMKSYSDLGPIGGSIFATIVGTLGALNIRKIMSTKEPKVDTNIRGYATGGIIAGGVSISRPNGDDVLITAKRGEVILNEEQQKRAGGYNFFSALGVPGFATGGVVGSMPASQSSFVQNYLTSQINMDGITEAVKSGITESTETLASAVRQGANEGAAQGSQSGIRDLSTDRQILNNSAY